MVLVAVLGSIAVGLGVILVVSLDAIDLLGKVVVYGGALYLSSKKAAPSAEP
jgi:hypothetical protein